MSTLPEDLVKHALIDIVVEEQHLVLFSLLILLVAGWFRGCELRHLVRNFDGRFHLPGLPWLSAGRGLASWVSAAVPKELHLHAQSGACQ